MKFKKIISIILSTTVFISVLSGCSNANSETATNNEVNSSSTSGEDKVTLKMLEHSNPATNEAIKQLNEDFMKKYPNVTIETSVLSTDTYSNAMKTRLAAGDVDIFEFSCFNIETPEYAVGVPVNANIQYIESGLILDLTDQDFIKNWPENTIKDAGSYKDKVYNLQSGKVAINGIYYNKKMFEENGWEVPNTWDELMTLCKTIESSGIAPFTGGGKDIFPVDMMFPASFDGFEDSELFLENLWNGSRKFNDEKTLESWRRMEEFASYYEKGVSSIDYSAVISRFISGKAAMLPDGSWQAANINDTDPNFDYGYFSLPTLTGPGSMTGKYDIGYAGYSKSENVEWIYKWMEFYSEKENYTKYVERNGFIPAMDDIIIENKFNNESREYNHDFKITFDSLYLAARPTGIGKYGKTPFDLLKLKLLGGDVDTIEELANLTQSDFDKALNNVK